MGQPPGGMALPWRQEVTLAGNQLQVGILGLQIDGTFGHHQDFIVGVGVLIAGQRGIALMEARPLHIQAAQTGHPEPYVRKILHHFILLSLY
ncbi:hypothetical protein D3C75_1066900 [compost metagenome]